MHHFSHMAKKLWNWSLRIHLLRVHIYTAIQWLPTWYIQMYTVQWGCWLLTPLEWVAGLGMGTSTARGARFPVPNRSYPAEREPARSSPIHPIARLSGSERLRRSTAKILLALLYASLNWVITGSDNDLSPVRHRAIIWTNAGILLIGPLGTYFSEVLIGIQTFSFKKLHLKTSFAKWCLFCPGLNELTHTPCICGSCPLWNYITKGCPVYDTNLKLPISNAMPMFLLPSYLICTQPFYCESLKAHNSCNTVKCHYNVVQFIKILHMASR